MTSTVWFVLLLSLLLTASGEDLFDNIEPFKERFEEIRKTTLPITEDKWKEGLYQIATFYIPVDGKSALCKKHSNFLLDSTLNMENWALKMIDASSKLPSGVLDGNFLDMGSYDQCLSVVAPEEMFIGQQCLVETRGLLPEKTMDSYNPEISFFPSLRFDVKFSVCVPSSCSAEDVMAHMNTALSSINATAELQDSSCSSKVSKPFSAGEWLAILFFLALLVLVLAGSVYDSVVESGKNPYLTAFSVGSNIPKMLDSEPPPDDITCINGLRFLGLCWVIMGHRYLLLAGLFNIRYRDVFEETTSVWFTPMQSMKVSVDIFFFITGVLVTYGHLRKCSANKPFNLFRFYLLRYLRLTPSLLVVVVFVATIGIRVNDGPFWGRLYDFFANACKNNWWSTLTYISNYANPVNICVLHSWYLAVDFQLYVLSPLLFIPLHKKPKLGLALTALFLVLTTAAGFWNAYSLGLRAGGVITSDRRSDLTTVKEYIVTHVRAAPFFIGVLLGFVIFKIKEGQLVFKMSKKTLWAGWLLSIFFILFSVMFINHFETNDGFKPWKEVSFQVLHRHLFTLGIAWTVLACTLGHGGWVDTFLSWKAFVPLARLSFSVYLVHLVVQNSFFFSSRTTHSFNALILWYDFFSDVTLSYLIAGVFYLVVECPCSNIVSMLFKENKISKEMPTSPPTVLSDIRPSSSA